MHSTTSVALCFSWAQHCGGLVLFLLGLKVQVLAEYLVPTAGCRGLDPLSQRFASVCVCAVASTRAKANAIGSVVGGRSAGNYSRSRASGSQPLAARPRPPPRPLYVPPQPATAARPPPPPKPPAGRSARQPLPLPAQAVPRRAGHRRCTGQEPKSWKHRRPRCRSPRGPTPTTHDVNSGQASPPCPVVK